MVIVDTAVWIDFLRGTVNPQTIWLNQALDREDVGLTSLILCEVLQGVQSKSQFRGFQQDLLKFPILDAGSTRVAIASAENYQILRQKGITMRRTIDCIIATFCIQHAHRLLYKHRDFDAFHTHLGLDVVRVSGSLLH